MIALDQPAPAFHSRSPAPPRSPGKRSPIPVSISSSLIDETYANTKLYRLRGRALKGNRLHDTAPFGSWSTQTFIAGLRQNEMIAPWGINGPVNKAAFEGYTEIQLTPALNPEDVGTG